MKRGRLGSSLLVLGVVLLVSCMVHAEGIGELLPEKLIDSEKNEVTLDKLGDKLIGLYFSASWCPPCKQFTPILIKLRDDNQADLEVVFISSDRSAEDQMKYMKDYKMSFLAVPLGAEQTKKLQSKFNIRGIPSLIILDSSGKVISTSGVSEVRKSPEEAIASWKKNKAE